MLPLALVTGGAKGLVITAVNSLAAAHGAVPGQSLADARAAYPALRTRPAEFTCDVAALVELARWAGRYGASRNTEGADGLWIDITGIAHLFGGEAALLSDLHQRLSAAGFSPRLGLADTAAAAWALARFGAEDAITIAPPGATKAALDALPVEALQLTQAAVVLLKRLGLYRISQLHGLPRAALARRFRDLGTTGRGRTAEACADTVVLRLDQALGAIREPRRPLGAIPVRLVRHVYTEPLIVAAGIERAMATAVAELCALLEAAGEGARQLCLTLYRTDGTSAEVAIGTAGATRDGRHLTRLLAEKLGAAALDLGFGVDVVTLEGAAVEPLAAVQGGLGARSNTQDCKGEGMGLAQLVDRLSNRLGPECVYRIARNPSHIPEQADRRIAVFAAEASAAPLAGRTAPRPAFLLPMPEPITVTAEVPEGPPRRFQWRRSGHRIVKAGGPERIERAWWQTLGRTPARLSSRPRDYYRVEDDRGGRYWVFREGLYDRDTDEGAPTWYLHGLFA